MSCVRLSFRYGTADNLLRLDNKLASDKMFIRYVAFLSYVIHSQGRADIGIMQINSYFT